MDGDGDLDIVSASNLDDTIAWYENDGAADPSWTAADIATSADYATSVYVADMDDDGDLDIVSGSLIDDTIAWYENDGAADPSWTAADIATSADGAESVYVADMDGDGDLDIVSASQYDDTIAWYENDGAADPSWTAADIATSADGAASVYVADIDGDGDLDIVSASWNDDTIAWYEETATGTWSNTSSMTNFTSATCSVSPSLPTGLSIDSSTCTISGTPTVASGNTTYTITANISNVTYQGSVWLSSSYLELTPSVEGADLFIDEAMTNITFEYDTGQSSSNLFIANPTWTASTVDTGVQLAETTFVADVDADGDLDIVSASGGDDTIAWYENDGAANPTWTASDITTSQTTQIRCMLPTWTVTVIWMSFLHLITTIPLHGMRTTVPPTHLGRQPTLTRLQTPQLGCMLPTWTVMATSTSFQLRAVMIPLRGGENDGAANPTWTASDITTSADGAASVYVADMDGDGDLDIVSASANDNTVAWYENDGAANPSWTATDISTTENAVQWVVPADMDSDGDLDIVTSSLSPGNSIAWARE